MAESSNSESKVGFFDGVKAEFEKITWPDRISLLKQSGAVVGVSVVLGVIIAVLDYLALTGINWLIAK